MNNHFLPIKTVLSEIMQSKRIQSNLSIQEVVDKIRSYEISMSEKTYERIEKGNFYPTLEQFFIIIKVLQCETIIDGIKIT